MSRSRDIRRKNLKRIKEGKVKAVYKDRKIEKKRHHTNPQFVLKGFSKYGKLTKFNTNTGRCQSGVKVATVHDYFYTVYGNSDPDVFENAMWKDFETPAVDVFRRIIDDNVWPLDKISEAVLSRFITLQILRSPEKRRVDLQISNAFLKQNNQYQEFSKRWLSEEVRQGEINAGHLDYWWNHLAPKLVHYVFAMKKILVTFSEDCLATSDSPVIPVYRMDDVEPLVILGKKYLDTSQPLMAYASYDHFKSAAFFYPISRRNGLILLPPSSKCPAASIEGKRKLSEIFNFLTGELSEDFYFHPDDSKYLEDFFANRKLKSSFFHVNRFLKSLENDLD